jgi:hypothetical protein
LTSAFFKGGDDGGLIRTKGTKKLAAHFNEEIDTWIGFWRNVQETNAGALFDRAGGNADLLAITDDARTQDNSNALHSRRTDYKCLLPDIQNHPIHKNLEARWRWFLTLANAGRGGLQQANHNKIADGILKGLLTKTGPGAYVVDCITFDAVEAGDKQDVALTAHRVDGRVILEIVLITPPIPPHHNLATDPLDLDN